MSVTIVNNRIDGLRVTIFDVLHYLLAGRSSQEIVDVLPLTLEQVEAAVQYVKDHHDEVMATHRRIEARIAQGNSPEVEASARAGRARMEALRQKKATTRNPEVNGEGAGGRRQ